MNTHHRIEKLLELCSAASDFVCYIILMNEVDKIYSALSDTEKILVFTSQTAAQNALSSYIEAHPGKAVFRDRALSWDSFYLSLLDTKGKRSVTKTERKVFAYSFLKDGGLGRLKYFASALYPESLLAYSSSIASLLPYFPSPEDPIREHMSPAMLHDTEILRTSYSEFLGKKGLYEKNYLVPDYSKIEKDRYIFVFPRTFTSSKVEAILSLGIVDVIDSPEAADTPLVEYPNALSEIRWTLREIEEDRKKYRDDEIAISSSSLSTYRPYLESEAKKRDITLVFTSARPLSEYPEGRFLHQIYSTVMSSWSFDETKKLILSPQFPFKDREMMISILRHGVDRKMEDKGIRSWLRVLSAEEREFFKSLSSAVDGIVKSRRSSLTVALIQKFRDTFFEEGEWNEKDDRVFGSALEILEGMGEEEISDLYKLFLSLLDETQYVERSDEEKGIRVYSYPASAGLITPVHYVIGLDDKTTGTKIDDYPFLVSLERPEVKDISSPILSVYRSPVFTKKLVISGTTEGFDGARLLPSLFLDSQINEEKEEKKDREKKEEEKKKIIDDGYSEERALWIENTVPRKQPYISQSEGYKKAKNTSLRGRREEVIVTPFTDENISISVSNMKNFDLCPYRGYASTRLGLQDKDFEPKIQDSKIIGEVLHDTVEEVIRNAGTIANINLEEMQLTFLRKLDEKEKHHEIPTKYVYAHFCGKYYDKLEGLQTSSRAPIYNSFEWKANEMDTKKIPLTGNIKMKGRIDTILVNEETGDAYIIDWKTKGDSDYDAADLEATSLQVILYAVLLENDDSLSVKGGAFYSFKDKQFKVVWPTEHYTDGRGLLKMEGFTEEAVKISIRGRLEKIRKALEEGRFTPDYTEDSCTYCPYPRLCREKFVARKEENND